MVKSKKVAKKPVNKIAKKAVKKSVGKAVKNPTSLTKKAPARKPRLPPIIAAELVDNTPAGHINDVMDECDQADIHQHNFINGAIAAHVAQLPDPTRESLKNCKECGDEIPKGRRKALPGVDLCVPCQEEIDNANKRRQVLQGYVFKNAVTFDQ